MFGRTSGLLSASAAVRRAGVRSTTVRAARALLPSRIASVARTPFSTATEAPQQPSVSESPSATGAAERHSFQAETRQLLNIVANSLYTDKHVFIRELVSNGSDALEKVRHKQVAGEPIVNADQQLQVTITTDEAEGTIIIQDTGIGMDKQELIDHLGTIARSGSRAFMQKLKEQGTPSTDTGANIIGQFGVGFYSSFMVSDDVKVYSLSATPGAQGYLWTSKGDGSYEITPVEGLTRGTKVVIKLKDSCREFATTATVKDVLTRYSNFVNFPIALNGKQVNTVQALWCKSRSEVTDEQYTEFYKYKSGDFDPPLYRLHFTSDAPIALKSLLFVGQSHEEKYGMGRMRPGVDLYSRKVLIEAGSRIMPDWMRFVVGVVDSEDIPLNISRESMQDSALMRRLRSVLTRKVLRFLEGEARRDPQTYCNSFFAEFGNFLKEGAVTDATYAADIARLLRFESSALPAGTLSSFDEYVSRMPPGQKDIFYLVAPHRGIAETSPYMEAFKRGGEGDVEVLFLYSPIDDFVMGNLREFNGRKLTTAETADLDPEQLQGIKAGADKAAESKDESSESGAAAERLSDEDISGLGSWLKAALPGRVSKVRATTRLKNSPCVVTDHESAAIRRMMRLVEQTGGRDSEGVRNEQHMLPPQTLEINPTHPVIVRLNSIKEQKPDLAIIVAEQMFDNALVAAGLVDDARTMLPRLTALLERVLSVPTRYRTNDDVTSRRYVSPKEQDELDGIEVGREMYKQLDKELKSIGKGPAADGADSMEGLSMPADFFKDPQTQAEFMRMMNQAAAAEKGKTGQ